jgi:hypothetical protein
MGNVVCGAFAFMQYETPTIHQNLFGRVSIHGTLRVLLNALLRYIRFFAEGSCISESRLKSNAMVPSQQEVGVERLYTEEDLDVGTVLACVSGQSWRELAGTNSPLAVVGLDFTMRTVSVLNWLEKKTLGTVRSL